MNYPIPQEYDYVREAKRVRNRKYIVYIGTFCLLLVLTGYVSWQARDWFLLPSLSVETPQDGEILYDTEVIVSGTATPGADLTINGARVYSNEIGVFSFELILAQGVHDIEVRIRNRFGREQTVLKQIVVREE